jgi:hypothetical protein
MQSLNMLIFDEKGFNSCNLDLQSAFNSAIISTASTFAGTMANRAYADRQKQPQNPVDDNEQQRQVGGTEVGDEQPTAKAPPTREIVVRDGEEYVVYRRVQGGGSENNTSYEAITVGEDGSLIFNDLDRNLNVSIDHGEHSQYFLDNKRPGGTIVEFEVPQWFDDFVQETWIPQRNSSTNPMNQGGAAPKITDPMTPGISVEFPPPWIEWMQEYASNGRIVVGD